MLLALRADCAQRMPLEACGLLLGDAGLIREARPAANVAANPARHFEIDPAVLFTAHRAQRAGGPDIVGCYHSHPEAPARPSSTDAERAFDVGWVWIIVGSDGEKAYRVVPGGGIFGRFEAQDLEIVEG